MKRQIGSGRCISNEAKKVRMLKSLSLNNLLLKTKQDRNWLQGNDIIAKKSGAFHFRFKSGDVGNLGDAQ